MGIQLASRFPILPEIIVGARYILWWLTSSPLTLSALPSRAPLAHLQIASAAKRFPIDRFVSMWQDRLRFTWIAWDRPTRPSGSH